MRDEDTAIGGARAQFPSTRHSLLDTASGSLPEEALERVIAI